MSATLLESDTRATAPIPRPSPGARWAGRILTGMAALLLVLDTAIKIVAASTSPP